MDTDVWKNGELIIQPVVLKAGETATIKLE